MKPTIQQILEGLLKSEGTYYNADSDSFRKAKLKEDAIKGSESLIELLLGEERLASVFFKEVAGTKVFLANAFLEFVSMKNYLPDSHTKYKQSLGLSVDDEHLFRGERGAVSLVWPYKDCVLEGGLSKESDGKRNEIFYNEVLGRDQIDTLLEAKAFVEFKRLGAEGSSHVFRAFERDAEGAVADSMLVKGNNLLALWSLRERYRGKIKLIYIDPPYNTGSDTFTYNDSFSHSTWLTFMKNRLSVARELLTADGVVFISIDDNEQAYLKVLCDEIFGRENFVATIPRKTRTGKADVPYQMSQDFDWLLVYSRSGDKRQHLFKRTIERKYYKSDDFPDDEWRLNPLTKQTTTKERPNSDFTIVNPKNGDRFPVNPNSSWRITKETFPEYYKQGKIVFPGDYDFLNISKPMLRKFKSEEMEKKGEDYDKAYVSTDFLNEAMDTFLRKSKNAEGTKKILDMFGSKVFPFSKPVSLIKKIIEISTNKDDIVLDFFAGSGTTAHAVMELNKEDGGNRRFILVEQLEEHVDVIERRLQKVLAQGDGRPATFVSFSLAEANEAFAFALARAKTSKELASLYDDMQQKSFLSYRFKEKEFAAARRKFEAQPTEQQRQFLMGILEKNMLYVNRRCMEDELYKMGRADITHTEDFYLSNGAGNMKAKINAFLNSKPKKT